MKPWGSRKLPMDKEIDWKEYVDKYDDISYKPQVDKNQKEYSFESFVSYSPSLKEYLGNQLSLVKLSQEEYFIGQYIIQNINENGYLVTSLEEIASLLKVNVLDVEKILKIIQTFEPLGVGARDLKECLLIQIKEKGDLDPLVVDIVEKYLDDIACNRMIKISKELNINIEKMQEVCDYIKTLEPKPGRAFSNDGDNVRYIIPDATIELIDGEFVIIINDSTGPRLNINNFYKNLISSGSDEDTSNFLSEKLNSAMWIIKSIEQRRQTIYKVVESILKFQIEFLNLEIRL